MTAIEALLSYQQADEDGVMVLTSRQAIHEVADQVESLRHALEMVWDANQSDPHLPGPALAAIRAALDGAGTSEPDENSKEKLAHQAAKEPVLELYALPFHEETMAGLSSLTIRKDGI